jgi:hypothetical protein
VPEGGGRAEVKEKESESKGLRITFSKGNEINKKELVPFTVTVIRIR